MSNFSRDSYLNRYNLTDLRVFRAVADEGNLSKGAERCHLSPSSVSLRLKGLEEAVGAQLLERRTRGMKLTRAGSVMLQHTQRVIALLEQMHRDLQPLILGTKDQLVLLANDNVIHTHLPVDLAIFLNLFPALRISTEEKLSPEIVTAVASGRADLGIVAFAATPHPDLAFHPYCEDQLVVLAPPNSALTLGQSTPFEACLGQPFISLMTGASCHAVLLAQAAALGGRLDIRIQVPSHRDIAQLVALGAGIGVVPRSALTAEDFGKLSVVPLEDNWATLRYEVCVRTDAMAGDPALRQLVELLCRRWEAGAEGR